MKNDLGQNNTSQFFWWTTCQGPSKAPSTLTQPFFLLNLCVAPSCILIIKESQNRLFHSYFEILIKVPRFLGLSGPDLTQTIWTSAEASYLNVIKLIIIIFTPLSNDIVTFSLSQRIIQIHTWLQFYNRYIIIKA